MGVWRHIMVTEYCHKWTLPPVVDINDDVFLYFHHYWLALADLLFFYTIKVWDQAKTHLHKLYSRAFVVFTTIWLSPPQKLYTLHVTSPPLFSPLSPTSQISSTVQNSKKYQLAASWKICLSTIKNHWLVHWVIKKIYILLPRNL